MILSRSGQRCVADIDGIIIEGFCIRDPHCIHILADRCAPLFGFRSVGAMTVTEGKGKFTFYRFHDGISIPKDITNINESFRRRIQDFVVFRWIIGSPVNLQDVYLEDSSLYAHFHSRRECHPLSIKNLMVDNIEFSVKRMLNGRNASNVREDIENTMKMVNTELYHKSAEIFAKINY